jgi:hypothetical protein
MTNSKRPIIGIYDTETDTTIEREMTDSEFAQYEIDQAEWLKIKIDAETKIAQRQAILDRLGLTSEEAQLLLGGN